MTTVWSTEQDREYVRADSLRGVTLVSDVRDVTLWGEESNPATGKERQANDSDKDSFALLWGRWDETATHALMLEVYTVWPLPL